MLVLSFILYVSLALAAPIRVRKSRTLRTNEPSSSLTARKGSARLASLIPADASKKWTTLLGASGTLPLEDETFRITHKSDIPYDYTDAPDGEKSLRVHYPKGSYRLGVSGVPKGGISFYAPGPESVDLTTAKEATFGYSVMFPEGFEWVMGGKLPGLCAFTFVMDFSLLTTA